MMSKDRPRLPDKYQLREMLQTGRGEGDERPGQFGNWHFDPNTQTLEHRSGYWIPLGDMIRSSLALDYIFQVARKPWATEEDVGVMIALMAATVDPQENLCSHGKSLDADMSAILHKAFPPSDVEG